MARAWHPNTYWGIFMNRNNEDHNTETSTVMKISLHECSTSTKNTSKTMQHASTEEVSPPFPTARANLVTDSSLMPSKTVGI